MNDLPRARCVAPLAKKASKKKMKPPTELLLATTNLNGSDFTGKKKGKKRRENLSEISIL